MYRYFENVDDILNIGQFCEILDVGRSTGYKLLKSGRVKGFKIGKVWRIPAKSVEAFVSEKINQSE